MNRPSARIAVACVPLLALVQHVDAQCAAFASGFGASGVAGSVYAQVEFDDGNGPALYVGGDFTSAGDVVVADLARWDGASWSALTFPSGHGLEQSNGAHVSALAVFDDGSGPALFVGGEFQTVDTIPSKWAAKWDGNTWYGMPGLSANFSNTAGVLDFAVFDDGSGPALFAGGGYNLVNGQMSAGIAKWTGAGWSTVATGVGNFVYALAVFDDGSGDALYLGGQFSTMFGAPANNIARWDGVSFTPLGIGTNASVNSLAVFDDGSGPALFAGGQFTSAGGTAVDRVAKWDGSTWAAAGSLGPLVPVDFLAFDDGSGTALYAACSSFIGIAGPAPSIQVFDGSTWSIVGGGTNAYGWGSDLYAWDDGGGDELYFGGQFTRAGGVLAFGIAKLIAGAWTPLTTANGKVFTIDALALHDDGGGDALYADSGDYEGDRVEKWNGASWSQLGDATNGNVEVLHSSGGVLYAGGTFSQFGATATGGIAQWNGSAWSALGSGLGGGFPRVLAMAEFDFGSGPVLVVGGAFNSAGGDANGKRVASWDGANWSSIGVGFDDIVRSLAVFDDGAGPKLYAGGKFTVSGATSVEHIARWNGVAWEPLGPGTDSYVDDMAVYDDGIGRQLYAVGDFVYAGGLAALNIARWDGSAWSTMPTGGSIGRIAAAEVFDDGWGPALYIGGPFNDIGGTSIDHVARWDGSAWSALSSGVNSAVNDLLTFDRAGGGDSLFLAGGFNSAGGKPSLGIAEWTYSCPCPPVSYCTAKTNSQGCTPAIFSTGTTSIAANNLRVKAANVLNNKNGLLFWGFAPKSSPFQGGTLCVQSPTIRTPVQDSGGNAPPDDCSGEYSFHFNASYFASHNLAPGDRIYCQYWSRDPASPSTTGLTDALVFTTCP